MKWINSADENYTLYASSGCYTNFGNTCRKYKFCNSLCILNFTCKTQNNCAKVK